MYPNFPVSLDCPYLIAPSVFSNVYLPLSLDCPYLIAPSVFSNVYLPLSLDCPYLIAPSVFSNVYLPLSLDCPYLIAPSVFSTVYYLQRILNNVKNKEQIKTAFCTLHLCNSIITIQNLRSTSRTTGRRNSYSSNCNRYFPSYEGVFILLSTTILLLYFTISVTRRVSYNNQELLTRCEHLGSP